MLRPVDREMYTDLIASELWQIKKDGSDACRASPVADAAGLGRTARRCPDHH